MLRFKLSIVFFLYSTSFLFSQVVDSTKVKSIPDSLFNKPAPYFSGTSLNGTVFTSENLKGKVTLLNFWFIGCQPCMYEISYLNQILNEYSGKDFLLISIASNSKSDLIPFMDTTKERQSKIATIQYEIIPACKKNGVIQKDKYHRVVSRGCDDIARDFFVSGMPTTFIIDKKGTIRYVSDGFGLNEEVSTRIVNEYKAMIDKLLTE